MQFFKQAALLTLIASAAMMVSANAVGEVGEEILETGSKLHLNHPEPAATPSRATRMLNWFQSKGTLTKSALVAAPLAAAGGVYWHYSDKKKAAQQNPADTAQTADVNYQSPMVTQSSV